MKKIAAVILAAGKGKRMSMQNKNKVTLALVDKPMIRHIIDFMHELGIDAVVVVVGFAKESVIEVLKDYNVVFVEQTEQLGTGHALACALEKLPKHITDVLVVYGDDAVLYAEKHVPIIQKLFDEQKNKNAAATFLTIELDNPSGLGRIVRDSKGNFLAIIEEKDATEEQKKITEINPGCFVFSVAFLRIHMPQIEKSPVTGEYYINNFIDLAIKYDKKITIVKGGKVAWRGVNTPEELKEAQRMFLQAK